MLQQPDIDFVELSAGESVVGAGAVIVAYRGEHGASDGVIHSRTPYSVTFSSVEAAKAYALSPNQRQDLVVEPRLICAQLRIDRPVFNTPDDAFVDVEQLVKLFGRAVAERIAVRMEKFIYNTNNWLEMADQFDSVEHLLAVAPERLGELYFEAYPMLDDQELVRLFKAAGFDGAIYMGSGETFDEVEYRVFDQSQIIPISIACARTGQPLDRFMHLFAAGSQLDSEDEECLDESVCPSP